MAERRMFTNKITESDAFLDMPLSSQALYFHLCMYADDDGFVKNPKRISRMIGVSEDDFKLLIAKSFVFNYESGVIVIKHWRMHNLLRKDRYTETEYLEEKSMLFIKDNGAYTLDEAQGKPLMATKWQPNGNQMATQDSIGKDSIGYIEKNNKKEIKKSYGEFENVKLTDDEYRKLQERFPNDYADRIENLGTYLKSKNKKYSSHYATILAWDRKDKKDTAIRNQPKKSFGNQREYTKDDLDSLYDN